MATQMQRVPRALWAVHPRVEYLGGQSLSNELFPLHRVLAASEPPTPPNTPGGRMEGVPQ